jgi:hypothetical protein
MLSLVRKRHDGEGWIVFSELSNRASGRGDRYADAFALGVWASTKYEAHLYEFKTSREDLKKELRDPTKAEGIGKYAAYWWLVLANESVMRDLVIPEAWGILVPTVRGGSKILTVVRKAPKLKPVPFSPQFAIACVRNINKRFKSEADYALLQDRLSDVLAKRDMAPLPDVAQKDAEIAELKRKLQRIESTIERFQVESGVDLSQLATNGWGGDTLGREFKIAHKLHQRIVSGDVSQEIAMLSSTAQRLADHARELAEGAVALRHAAGHRECAPNCRSRSQWGKGQCSCGAKPLSEIERKLDAEHREEA